MEARAGGWILALLTFLACGVGAASWPASGPSAEVLRALAELDGTLDPARMSARELRQLPGVGETLALAIVRARDGALCVLEWEEVEGIGPSIADGIRAWFAARDVAARGLPPARGAPAPAAGADPRAGYDGRVRPAALLCAKDSVPLAFLLAAAACGSDPATGAPAEDARAEPSPSLGAAPVEASEPARARSSTVEVAGTGVHVLEAGPGDGRAVLLLHGARFRAATWEELGTLDVLAGRGCRAIAIDLPGYGESAPNDAAPEDFLEGCLDALGLERAVIVSPSMSGSFSLPLLARSGARFAGFVPIAPAGAESFTARASADVPTLILWGEKDDVVPVAGAAALAEKLPGARVEILPGAAHPCYLDLPERFHELLLAFLATLDG